MEILTATFRIVTPMFLGGADQSPSDGIRPPSVKGALRFWWRALNWGRFRTASGATDTSALQELHKEEARLFGSAADGKGGGGQGCFLLQMTDARFEYGRTGLPPGEKYLRGQGLNTRDCLNEGTFCTQILFRPTVSEPKKKAVRQALIAWGSLGGLGSRSRHGMGSIALEKIVDGKKKEIWTAPTTQEEYEEKIKELLVSFATVPEPDYSAFSQKSRVDILLSATMPHEVLNQFGMKMLDYRSWGQTSSGNILPSGKVSEKRFKDDHDWLRVPTFRTTYPDFHPQRVVFGLPHNYGKWTKVNGVKSERRASPLLFHVHRLSDNAYIGVSILLRSRFLPDGEKINADGEEVPPEVDWNVIIDFLDGKIGNPPTSADRFPCKKPVLP
jgi:CRISPR-associated protein Cmr1